NNVIDDTLIAHKIGDYSDVLISRVSNANNKTLLIYKHHSNKESIKNQYTDVIEVDNTSILINFASEGVGVGVIPNYLIKSN
ncbi:LysR family transcriptional regulator, partial [Vibrio parahaemolyticus]|nr:LysR family transcriptional regulator [Vibrio parahaemolyticus]